MIHLLPDTVSSQLRSGVAITSVAQCVEELVLNSLDARATCVAVRLDLSCFKIQVVDNGSGIPYNQMDLLASRHHTSKCCELQDLDNLEYFGFRGEALASIVDIAAVVDIVSRIKHCSKTYIKLFTRGKQKPVTECKICRPSAGTTVTIHNLFNKLPVRKKTTNPGLELEKVRQRLEGIALMHPSLSLSLRNDENNNKILQSRKCNSTIGVFRHLFSSIKATSNLKEVCCSMGSFQVQGFISCDGHLNKNLQFVYINSRLVLKTKIHKLLNKLLSKLFSSRKKISELKLAAKGSPSSPTKQGDKHGVFLVNVTCAYNEYDITFDPAKTLVEFKDWEAVLSAVERVVKDFQEQLSPEIPRDSVNSEEPETSNSKQLDLGLDSGEHVPTANSEISTASTARSLHSKLVKRPSFEQCENKNFKSEETLTEDFVESVLGVCTTDCGVEKTEKSYGESKLPFSGKEISDTVADGNTVCDKHVSNWEEDPLKISSPVNHTAEVPINDSGVDCDLLPNSAMSTPIAGSSSNSEISTVKTEGFSDLFQETVGSRLSVLKQKAKSIKQEGTSSLTVKDKLEQLKQSVNVSLEVTEQNPGPGMPRSSVLSSLQRLKEKLFKTKNKIKITAESTKDAEDDQMNEAVSPGMSDKKRPSQLKQTTSAKLARLSASSSCKNVDAASARKGVLFTKNEQQKQSLQSSHDVKLKHTAFVKNTSTENILSTSIQGKDKGFNIQQELNNTTPKLPGFVKISNLSSIGNHLTCPSVDKRLSLVESKHQRFIEPFVKNAELEKSVVNNDEIVVLNQETKDVKSKNYLTSEAFLTPISISIKNSSSVHDSSVNDGAMVGFDRIGEHTEQTNETFTAGPSGSAPEVGQSPEKTETILRHQNILIIESMSNETSEQSNTFKTSEMGANVCAPNPIDHNLVSTCSTTNTFIKNRQPMEFYLPEGQIRLSQNSQTHLNASELFKGYKNISSEPRSSEKLQECAARKDDHEPTCISHSHMQIEPSQGFDFKSLNIIQKTFSPCRNQTDNSLGFKVNSITLPEKMALGNCTSGIEMKPNELVSVKDFKPSEMKSMEMDNTDTIKSTPRLETETDMKTDSERSVFENIENMKLPTRKESLVNIESDVDTMCSDTDLVDLLITPSSQSEIQRSDRLTPPVPNQPAFFDSSLSNQLSQSTCGCVNAQIPEMECSDLWVEKYAQQSILSLPLTGLTNAVKVPAQNSKLMGSDDYSIVSVLRTSETEIFRSPGLSNVMEVTDENLLSPSIQTVVPQHLARTTAYRNNPLCQSGPSKTVDFLCKNKTNPPKQPANESVPSGTEIVSDVYIPHQGSNDQTVCNSDNCHHGFKQTKFNPSSDEINRKYSTGDELSKVKAFHDVQNAGFDASATNLPDKGCLNVDKVGIMNELQSSIGGTMDLNSNQTAISANSKNNSERKDRSMDMIDQASKSTGPGQIKPLQSTSSHYLCTSKPDPSQLDAQPVMINRSDPKSGRKIFIHPLTGHTLSEASWELFKEQNPVPPTISDNSSMYQMNKLLPHELANQLSAKPTPNNCQLENVASTSAEADGQGDMSSMWSDHVSGQSEVDNVKWRHPMTGTAADPSSTSMMTELFEEWHNPVFTVPEQEVTTAEIPGRQIASVKLQKAIHPCRFTKAMLTQTQVLGQVDDKFIACLMSTNDKNMSAQGNLLVLVDQHAAHERVRLEQLTEDAFVCDESGEVKVLKRSEVKPPIELTMTDDIVRMMTTYREKFLIMGIEFTTTGSRDTILLETLPACFMQREANEIKRGRNSIIDEMVQTYIKEQVELLKSTHGVLPRVPPTVHKLLCSQACHGAIKFGDNLELGECCDVVESLSLCNLPFQCAHGRPSVMPLLNINNFKNKFPTQVLKKPRLWKLRQAIEESEQS